MHREFRKRQAIAALRRLISRPAAATLMDISQACTLTYRTIQSLAAKAEINRYAG